MNANSKTELLRAAIPLGGVAASFFAAFGCKPPPTMGHFGVMGTGGPNLASNAADASLVLLMNPGAAGSPPPDSIKVGTRLTYYTATASIAGDGHWYVEVPKDDPDYDFENKATGQHYKDQGQKPSGGSSESFTEYNVVYMDNDTCVMELTAWGIMNGTVKLFFRTDMVGLPGFGGGLWARPDVLAQLPEINNDDQKILRGPYKLDGQSVDAVWLSANSGTGNNYTVYDRNTGMMVRWGSGADGTPGGLHAEGEVQTGGRFLAISTFKAARQTSAPWFGDQPPAWVQSINGMDFQGTTTVQIPGSMAVPLGVSMKYSLAERHTGWLKFKIEMTQKGMQGMPDQTTPGEVVYGSAMMDPLWIQPSTLASLQQGQQVDNDPITQMTTSVKGHQQGPKGDMVVIAESGANGELDYGYDVQSGMLVYMRNEDKAMYMTTELTLAGTS